MKTTFKQLIDNSKFKKGGFLLASCALSIGEKAERIGNQAKDAQDENGEHAKMFASNIQEWMRELAEMAQASIDISLEMDAKTGIWSNR